MEVIFRDFKQAQLIGSGPLLSTTITPIPPPIDPDRLNNFYRGSNNFSIQSDVRYGILHHANTDVRFSKAEGTAWVEVYVAYWKAVGEILAVEDSPPRGDWTRVYEAWKEVTNAFIKGYSSAGFPSWTVPCLYVAGRYLRIFAIKADNQARSKGVITFNAGFQDDVVGDFGKNEKLEDAARVINRIFTLCISDRAPLEESRKWGLYYTTNLLFKTYFKLNSIGLSKNILRALQAAKTDMPPLEAFPKSHIVTFKYYVGVILFLEEDYITAEEHLTDAWRMCHKDAHRNRELILTYLIPCHLLTTHTLPTSDLLSPYPRLRSLFTPLGRCIRSADLAGFDAALAAGENEFVKRRIYLTLERGRDIALRNLLRKVFLTAGFETAKEEGAPPVRRTRIPVAEFGAAIRLGSKAEDGRLENDEVECLLANMIYKNLMKGYIARERGIVVLKLCSNWGSTLTEEAHYLIDLYKLSKLGHKNMVRLLLEHGADIDDPGGADGTALEVSSLAGHGPVVRLLLEPKYGLDTSAVAYERAVINAARSGHESLVQLLTEHGGVDHLSKLQSEILQEGAHHGHESVVQLMLEERAI